MFCIWYTPSLEKPQEAQSNADGQVEHEYHVEEDEANECWHFILEKAHEKDMSDVFFVDGPGDKSATETAKGVESQEQVDEDPDSNAFPDDGSPGRVVVHVIASLSWAEFNTELGGLWSSTLFDSITATYWGKEARFACDLKERESLVTVNLSQLHIKVSEGLDGVEDVMTSNYSTEKGGKGT